MLIAYNPTNQQKFEAIPHTQAECPHCHQQVISKCGDIKIWHWAHKSKCKYHTEPETEWHLQWKKRAIENKCEIEVCRGERIADAVIKDKVIEFQHSNITSKEIVSRSTFYDKVDWIFDYRDKADKMFICVNEEAKASILKLRDISHRHPEKWSKIIVDSEFMDLITQMASIKSFYLNRRVSMAIGSLFKSNSPCFGKVYLDITEEGGDLRLFNVFTLINRLSGEGVIIENPEYIFQ